MHHLQSDRRGDLRSRASPDDFQRLPRRLAVFLILGKFPQTPPGAGDVAGEGGVDAPQHDDLGTTRRFLGRFDDGFHLRQAPAHFVELRAAAKDPRQIVKILRGSWPSLW
jgi:hypothetical protein